MVELSVCVPLWGDVAAVTMRNKRKKKGNRTKRNCVGGGKANAEKQYQHLERATGERHLDEREEERRREKKREERRREKKKEEERRGEEERRREERRREKKKEEERRGETDRRQNYIHKQIHVYNRHSLL